MVSEDARIDVDGMLGTPLVETPLGVGRAIAAMARDTNRKELGGKISFVASLMRRYGITDERGYQPPPFVSLRAAIFATKNEFIQTHLVQVPSRWWIVPDIRLLPLWLLKLLVSSPQFA